MAAGATAATTLSVLMSFIYILIYFKMFKKDKPNASINEKSDIDDKTVWQIVKSILWVSIPMSLSAILTTINRNIDSHTVVNLLENFLSEKEAIKQYGILSGKVEILTSLPLAFNVAFATALVPAITAAKVKNRMDDAVRRISFSLLTTVVIVLPCVVGMIVLADPILKLVFPNASEGAFILQVCVVATIFTAMEQTINGALQGLGRIFVPACALTIGVILKLILNYILVPLSPDVCVIGGAAGAAFATNVCHIVAFSISFAVLRKTIKLKISFGKTFIKPLIASLVMSVAAYGTFVGLAHVLPAVVLKVSILGRNIGITGSILATIIALLVAGIVYVLSILLLKVFNKEDILMLPAGNKIFSILQKIGIYKEI
jgi:stage V sporulation protein B